MWHRENAQPFRYSKAMKSVDDKPVEPPNRENPYKWIGQDRDIIEMHDDLMEPVDVEWEVMKDPDSVLNGTVPLERQDASQ